MGTEEFWRMFAQVLGYGATAAVCLYLVLMFILKWRALEVKKQEASNGNGNGNRVGEMSRLVLAVIGPLFSELSDKVENDLRLHHDWVRGRHEQMALALQQIITVQTQQIETLKEITRVVRTLATQQTSFFGAVASLEKIGKLLAPKNEEEEG